MSTRVRRLCAALFAAVCALLGIMTGPAAQADTVASPPVLAHRLARVPESPVYDYSVTMVQTGTVQNYVWCGYGDLRSAPITGFPGGLSTDNIFHMSYDTRTGKTSTVEDVLGPSTDVNAWDNRFTCNPGVVMGHFHYNGKSYSIALYYTATDTAPATPTGGTTDPNRLGVAFSNDWHTFVKYPDPVVVPPCYTGKDGARSYGDEMPTPYNVDGGSKIELFHVQGCRTDPSDPASQKNVYLQATSEDGIHFTDGTQQVTNNGFTKPDGTPYVNPPNNMVFAYDKVKREWYAVVEHEGETERSGEGTYGFQLYRIKASSLFTGATPWQKLSTVDTNLTGYEENFKPALTRDAYGNVNVGSYPDIQMQFGFLNPRPAVNSTTDEDVASINRMEWDITSRTWRPGHPLLPLDRYYSATYNRSETTTGYVDRNTFDPDDNVQLGSLYEESTGQADRALYGCRTNTGYDYFVSADETCGGQKVLGVDGYAYSSAGHGRIPLYSCTNGTYHFVSNQSECEGATTETLLGYSTDRRN